MSAAEYVDDGYDGGFDDEDDYSDCQTCLGDGYEECDAPWSCFEQGCNGKIHRCPNCKGSGDSKDQWYW